MKKFLLALTGLTLLAGTAAQAHDRDDYRRIAPYPYRAPVVAYAPAYNYGYSYGYTPYYAPTYSYSYPTWRAHEAWERHEQHERWEHRQHQGWHGGDHDRD